MILISTLRGIWDRAEHKRYLGKLVEDEVQRGSESTAYDLRISSCRPKLDWNPYVTIRFRGEFYEYYREEPGPPPRRFIYYLRKLPIGRLAVIIREYRPMP